MIIIRKNGPSAGALALKNACVEAGHACVLSSKAQYSKRHLIINWGADDVVTAPRSVVMNKPEGIRTIRNKFKAFVKLRQANVRVPEFWTDRQQADAERGNRIILERHTLTGESGEGIVVKRREEALGEAPMYVEYVKKTAEFRVHVVGGAAVFCQQKRRDSDSEQTNDQKLIRNHANGWVFCVNDIDPDIEEQLRVTAEQAAAACGVEFAAVDLIVGKVTGEIYVLELNSKPGLSSPSVLAAYKDRLIELHPS